VISCPIGSVVGACLRAFAILTMVCLAGCAGRPGPEVLKANMALAQVAGARVVTVYVATSRQRAAPNENVFTNGRSTQMNYAQFTISVPPTHKAGNIEYPKSKPDPKTSFVTLEQRVIDKATFEREVARKRGGQKASVDVLVHGFNNNFQEALFRLVQISADRGSDAVPVLFSWPSQASVTGYVADKDSVTFSRDKLTELLTMLGKNQDIGNILVIGHSMGGWLTAESLRQLRLTGQDAVLRRLKVVLAAPDIDVDVFGTQLAAIGSLAQPMTVLVSKDDRALAISSFISGEHERLGALDVTDPRVQQAAKNANVQIIDITALSATDSFNHNRFSELAAFFAKRNGVNGNGQIPDLRESGAFVFNAVGTTLSSPFILAGKIVGGK
jgi:esterase/lipase superfamily enzyme